MTMAIQWFYLVEGVTWGPVSAQELRALAEAGTVTADTLVRPGRHGRWVATRKVKGLCEPVGTQSPPPPPIAAKGPPLLPWTPSRAFDPYHKWLGIPAQEQPPNHYRLLGIELFESDRDVIANAADRQMAHVRAFQLGEHAEVCRKILNEFAAARVCLLDPARKQEYDHQLRVEQSLRPVQPPPIWGFQVRQEAELAARRSAAAGGSPTADADKSEAHRAGNRLDHHEALPQFLRGQLATVVYAELLILCVAIAAACRWEDGGGLLLITLLLIAGVAAAIRWEIGTELVLVPLLLMVGAAAILCGDNAARLVLVTLLLIAGVAAAWAAIKLRQRGTAVWAAIKRARGGPAAGIGGWLLVPAFRLVSGPVLGAARLYIGRPPIEEMVFAFPFLGFQIYLAVVFFQKKSFVPKLMVACFLIELILTFAVASKAGDIAGAAGVATVWIPYFLLSKRVKATFVSGRRAGAQEKEPGGIGTATNEAPWSVSGRPGPPARRRAKGWLKRELLPMAIVAGAVALVILLAVSVISMLGNRVGR